MAGTPPSKKIATKAVKPFTAAVVKPVNAPIAVAAAPKPVAKAVEPKRAVAPVAKPVNATKPDAAPMTAASIPVPPVVEAPKPAPVEAVKTVTAPLPTPETKPVAAIKPVTEIKPLTETKIAAPVTVAASQKGNTMTDTVSKATEMFGDMNTRAKDAMSKGTKAIEELVEFSKGNLEAVVASGRVAAKGAEEIAKYSAEYGRTAVEKANATAKQFAAVKSPTEFFQLQGDVAKQTLDALVAEGSKFTESYLKLLGDVVQPMSNRVAVAVEKVKTTVSA